MASELVERVRGCEHSSVEPLPAGEEMEWCPDCGVIEYASAHAEIRGQCTLLAEAADRIEELEAERERLRGAIDVAIGLDAARRRMTEHLECIMETADHAVARRTSDRVWWREVSWRARKALGLLVGPLEDE